MVDTAIVNVDEEVNPLEDAGHVQEMLQKAEGNVDVSDRPQWLPDKFNSPEDLASAYQQLEKEFHSRQQEEPNEVSKDEALEQVQQATSEQMSDFLASRDLDYTKFEEEFRDKGGLSDEAYDALEKAGISSDLVDSYLNGQMAVASQLENAVYESVGGEDSYKTMVEWASDNLTEDEVNAYNVMMESPDQGTIMFAVNGLASRYNGANSSNEPQLYSGTGGQVSGNRFNSTQELSKAMSDPRYKTDPAFRQQVTEQLARSDIFN